MTSRALAIVVLALACGGSQRAAAPVGACGVTSTEEGRRARYEAQMARTREQERQYSREHPDAGTR